MNSRKPSRVLAVALMAMLLGVGGLALAPTPVAALSSDAEDRAFFCDFRKQGMDDEGVGATIPGDVATWWATYGPEGGVDCFDLEVTVSCGQIDATLTSYIILKDGTSVDRVWWSEGGTSSYAFPKTFAEDYNGGSADVTIAFNTPENQAIIDMDPFDVDHWIGTGGKVYTVDTDCLVEDEDATLNVIKFYDADANGEFDDGEQLIEGWKISVNGNDFFTPYSEFVDPGDYEVAEYMPVEPNWMATTPSPVNVTLAAGEEKTVEFGNVCVGAGGGKTLGFWSNKNGKKLFNETDRALMESLNLRKANGDDFDPADYGKFTSWLLKATATNMAYMLSAQLAAMKLNVLNGFVDGDSLVYAPGTDSANTLGFATISDLIAEANTELGLHGSTLADSAFRTYQQALKNALDNANNNLNFVQSTPCAFSFAE